MIILLKMNPISYWIKNDGQSQRHFKLPIPYKLICKIKSLFLSLQDQNQKRKLFPPIYIYLHLVTLVCNINNSKPSLWLFKKKFLKDPREVIFEIIKIYFSLFRSLRRLTCGRNIIEQKILRKTINIPFFRIKEKT